MLFLGREKKMIVSCLVLNKDIVAEWLRRWIANPLFIERVSSNLTDVDNLLVACTPCSWVYPLSHRDLSTPLSSEPLKTQSLDRAGLPQVDCHSYVQWRRLVRENSIGWCQDLRATSIDQSHRFEGRFRDMERQQSMSHTWSEWLVWLRLALILFCQGQISRLKHYCQSRSS